MKTTKETFNTLRKEANFVMDAGPCKAEHQFRADRGFSCHDGCGFEYFFDPAGGLV